MKTEREINMGLSYPINFAGSNTVRKKTTAPQQCKTSLDWNLTKIVVITLPETTPVTEARALTADLERANIRPWAWVMNNSLAAASPTSPLLAVRAHSEQQQLELVSTIATRWAVIPAQTDEPVGAEQLSALCS